MGKVCDVCFCHACKVGITMPVPSQEELERLYSSGVYRSEEGKRFNPAIELFILRLRKMRRGRIKNYIARGRILDIGCGRGLFLKIMRDDGWEVNGVEFSVEPASNVYGIPVMSGEPTSWGFPDAAFDVITMNHVLEHLLQPREMVHECRRLLKKGGLLMCAVPNFLSLQSSMGKKVWFHLDVPYHIYHFSEEGLRAVLTESGFRIVHTRRFDIEMDPFGWLQTLLNMSGIRKNLFYDMLKRPELRQAGGKNKKAMDILLTLLLLPFYIPLALLLTLFESFLLKRGGTLEFHAVKE
ncbi:MAG TPA: class I SAM-dependent methyltransferase [Thermodesulfovibrionales bacterium]|nr:class I SAM-dependent methyltransferase [Thermodesulfovibrionales bacterium]